MFTTENTEDTESSIKRLSSSLPSMFSVSSVVKVPPDLTPPPGSAV
jgi:hypothetical protein